MIDDAIDAAGEHLAQSGGLTVWSDDFASSREVGARRSVGRSRDVSVYDESEPAQGPAVL
ncbi:hypothetical protein [Kribbella sp. NPDC006257]|uniref:hypothetical protein n=1 Tax=Kribbella sp. NPDC006257 TaxID=3156738 RepID=UPI0033BCA766